MTDEDVFRRAFEVGTAFLALTQKRAESMLHDLADSGEAAKDQAQRVVDDAVGKGRQRTSELIELVRSEIRDQVVALGLATKDDIARLEAKLDSVAGSQAGRPTEETPTEDAAGVAAGTAPRRVPPPMAAGSGVRSDAAPIGKATSAARKSAAGRPAADGDAGKAASAARKSAAGRPAAGGGAGKAAPAARKSAAGRPAADGGAGKAAAAGGAGGGKRAAKATAGAEQEVGGGRAGAKRVAVAGGRRPRGSPGGGSGDGPTAERA